MTCSSRHDPAERQHIAVQAAKMTGEKGDLFFERILELFRICFCGLPRDQRGTALNLMKERIGGSPERLGERAYFLAAEYILEQNNTEHRDNTACLQNILRQLNELNLEFRSSFLCYTPDHPDHWICEQNTERGFIDLPHNGAVLALCNLLIITDDLPLEEGENVVSGIVLPYAEFLGAMLPRIPEEELKYAFLFLAAA